MEARISVITLGVEDVPRARAFYQALGWPLSGAPEERVAFFRNAGSRLALYRLDGIAEEAGQTPADPGSIRMTLAINAETRELVDECLDEAVRAGGTLLRPAQDRFWGGYSGYFADPDGHAWEVAFNPFWTIGEDGLPELP
ncbi:MAG TPA: VOC family protein [Thermoleophilia bacterium]|nr:VOC family protein [Thermoleophilia bacterium]